MKFIFVLLSILFSSNLWAQELASIPSLTGRVVDTASVLSPTGKDYIESTLKALEEEKGSQVAVLTVNSTQPETIEQFSFRVAEKWKIGRKKIDDGAVVVIAVKDRRSRIEVGYGLEGAIPDVTSKRILDDIVRPYFKNGDFDGGLKACVDSLAKLIRGEELPAPNNAQTGHQVSENSILVIVGIGVIISLILNIFFERIFAGLVASIIAAIIGFIFFIPIVGIMGGIFTLFLTAFASGSGGFSSGSGGSGWSSSSGGGFSGGGGSFGGGGSSGSW